MSKCLSVRMSRRCYYSGALVFLCLIALGASHVEGKKRDRQHLVPEGPRRRVMRDCDWRYRHGNETAKESCKRCVKDYEMPFPPRRSDVIKMREHCIPPPTPKEIGRLRCYYRASKEEARQKCRECLDAYDLPSNATRLQIREMSWTCLPHADARTMLNFSCERRFDIDANVTACKQCVGNATIPANTTYQEYKALKRMCVPKRNPKKRLQLYCRWRYDTQVKKEQCEKCVEEAQIPEDYDFSNIRAVREKCMPRPTRKESLQRSCERRFTDQVRVESCKQCVQLSNIKDDGPYEEYYEIRQKCLPRKSAKERLKESCSRQFSKEEDVNNCKQCADSFPAGENVVESEVRAMFKKCLSQNRRDYRPQLLEECQKRLPEPEDVVSCKKCVQNYYYWRIPKRRVKDVRKRCFVRGTGGNRKRREAEEDLEQEDMFDEDLE